MERTTETPAMASPAQLEARARLLKELFLSDATPVPFDRMKEAYKVFNAACAAANQKDPGYLPYPMTPEPEEVAERLATALSRLKILPPALAHKEDRVAVLKVLRLRLGFPVWDGWELPSYQKWYKEASPELLTTKQDLEAAIANGGPLDRPSSFSYKNGAPPDADYYGAEACFDPGATAPEMLLLDVVLEEQTERDKALKVMDLVDMVVKVLEAGSETELERRCREGRRDIPSDG